MRPRVRRLTAIVCFAAGCGGSNGTPVSPDSGPLQKPDASTDSSDEGSSSLPQCDGSCDSAISADAGGSADGGSFSCPDAGSNPFAAGCLVGGCPEGTTCVGEVGGVASSGGSYCAVIPVTCGGGIPTCACMASCACINGFGGRPETCYDSPTGNGISCDNGIR
jgi:hypothetical protein